jgi:prepilin-type N-terminal cleavage/methylation domain-containing protein
MLTLSRRGVHGFSLIELLAVMAILAILMGLLLPSLGGALQRARRMKWEFEMPVHLDHVRTQLKAFYSTQATYPALTLEQLAQLKVLDERTVRFLRTKGVEFHPFTHEHPDDHPVVRVVHRSGRNVWLWELTKGEIVREDRE